MPSPADRTDRRGCFADQPLGVGETLLTEPQQSEIAQRLGMARLEFEGAVERGTSLGVAASASPRWRSRGSQTRLQLDGVFGRSAGVGRPAQSQEDGGERGEDDGVGRVNPGGGLQLVQCLLEPAALVGDDAEVVMGDGVVRLAFEDLAVVERGRLAQATRPAARRARRNSRTGGAAGQADAALAAGLPTVTEEMVGKHAGHHRLADRHGADADARIVPALGHDLGVFIADGDGFAGRQDGQVGLTAKRTTTGSPFEIATEDAAAWLD